MIGVRNPSQALTAMAENVIMMTDPATPRHVKENLEVLMRHQAINILKKEGKWNE